MRAWLLILIGLTVGACGQFGRLAAVSDKDTGRASVLGIADARFLPTDVAAASALGQRLYEREAKYAPVRDPHAREYLLALSGGGDNGAFGAASSSVGQNAAHGRRSRWSPASARAR
jgi:hypothetical protein